MPLAAAAVQGIAPTLRSDYPQIDFRLKGRIEAAKLLAPMCPVCQGELDLSQPDMDDELGSQLVGLCHECDRLSLVIALPLSMVVILPLPSAAEAELGIAMSLRLSPEIVTQATDG